MFAPLIGMFSWTLGILIFGPGLFTLSYIILRFRDREDPQLGFKTIFSYLQAISLQTALASATFLLWVGLEFLAERVGQTPPDPSQQTGGWKGAFGTLILHTLLALLCFVILRKKTNYREKPAPLSLYRGFSTFISAVASFVSLSGLFWFYFANTSGSQVSMALAIAIVYLPILCVFIFLSLRYPFQKF